MTIYCEVCDQPFETEGDFEEGHTRYYRSHNQFRRTEKRGSVLDARDEGSNFSV